MAKEVQMTLDDTRKFIEKSKISLSLDDYNDLFSDFDPRPYSERALSDDFLVEAKKASRDKIEGIELNFLVPKDKRKPSDESVIRKRLKDHFRKHYVILHGEKHSVLNQGLMFIVIGIVLMFLATYILFNHKDTSFLTSFFVILLEPAGWFTFWEGLNLVVFKSREKNPDVEFYEKMSKAEINFFGY